MHVKFCNGSVMNINVANTRINTEPKKLMNGWSIKVDIETYDSCTPSLITMPDKKIKRVFRLCKGLI